MKRALVFLCVVMFAALPWMGALAARSGTFGSGMSWSLTDDGILTISGSGAMPDYAIPDSPPPWYEYCGQVKQVVFRGDITRIGNYAFAYCGKMTRIAFPESLTSIGQYAFYGCYALSGGEPADEDSLGDPIGVPMDGRLPGDVNADGVVDGQDVVRLMKWLAGEDDVEISEANADVNADGAVDDLDLLRLLRFFARAG